MTFVDSADLLRRKVAQAMSSKHALIPQEFIELLLNRINLPEVIGSYVKLKKSGKNYQGCCPFHAEKTPSFTVSPDKQFYYCFGCGANGNAINFLMEHEKLPFVDVVKQLAQRAGMTVPETPQSASNQRALKKKHSLTALMDAAQDYYSHQLQNSSNSQQARQYLTKRQLSQQTLLDYGVGFAPPGWANLLEYFKLKQYDLAEAVEAGLIIQKNEHQQYDRFRNRIIFPIRNAKGAVIGFGGRVLSSEDQPKYLNSPETPLFQKSRELYGLFELRKQSRNPTTILVVEGYMDVLMLAEHGIHNTVATLGTATSENHLDRLFQLVENIVFCFDGDKAGRKAAKRALDTSLPMIRDDRQIRFLFLPDGEDPDSLVQKEGPAMFEQRVSNSTPLSETIFDFARGDLDITQLDHRAKMVANAKSMINALPSGIHKELIISQLATETGLSIEIIQDNLRHHSNPTPAPHHSSAIAQPHEEAPFSEAPPPWMESIEPENNNHQKNHQKKGKIKPWGATQPKQPPPSLMGSTIKLLIQHPNLAKDFPIPMELEELAIENADLLLELIQTIRKSPEHSSAFLIGYLHNTRPGEQLANILSDTNELTETQHATQVYEDTLKKIKDLHIEQQLERNSNDPAKIAQLLQARWERENE